MVTRTEGYAAAPKIVFEIIRGMPPYEAPEGWTWVYMGDREWELHEDNLCECPATRKGVTL